MFLLLYCILTVWSAQSYVNAECPTIISKSEWDSLKPQHVQYLTTPIDLVIIQHTVTQTCSDDKSCAEIVRDLQKTHMEKSFLWDIGPSFLIGNTGKVYEGRGWNRVAIHTFGYNNQSIGIAFIGNFNNQEPSAQALLSARTLIQCGVEKQRLTADHEVVVHSQLIPTESPGKKITSKVMVWPDWKQDVTEIKKRADYKYDLAVETNDKSLPISLGIKNTELESRALTSPKNIDLLSNLRDVIAELINNIRDLALQILKTIESLLRGLHTQAALLIDTLVGVTKRTERITGGINNVMPNVGKSNTIKENKDSEAVRACANGKVKEIEDMIKNLGTVSSEAIHFSNIAVQDTKNCTELNFGIQSNTEACLNSVVRQTQRATTMYETQRNIALASIQTSLNNLPILLEACSQKHSSLGNTPQLPISPPSRSSLNIFGC